MTAALPLRLIPDEPDQVSRRRKFEAAHPHVTFQYHDDILGGSFWFATFAQDHDMRTVIGPPLSDLLDKLDGIFAEQDSRPAAIPPGGGPGAGENPG